MKITSFFTAALLACIVLGSGCARQEGMEGRERITIGTFNIAWLGDGNNDNVERTTEDYRRIAETIRQTGADVLGLQEIENSAAVDSVLKHLPGYVRFVGTKGRAQNVAVLYRSGITVESAEEYMPVAITEGRNRPGLVLQCRAGNFDWKMMVVHFKSTSRYDSTAQMKEESRVVRRQQAEKVRDWVQEVVSRSAEKDVILVGDFNDTPTREKEPTLTPLRDSGLVTFLTADLTSCKNRNWKVIDHIVVNAGARARYIDGTLFMWNVYDQYPKEQAGKISDHCPIVAQFDITAPDND